MEQVSRAFQGIAWAMAGRAGMSEEQQPRHRVAGMGREVRGWGPVRMDSCHAEEPGYDVGSRQPQQFTQGRQEAGG